MLDVHAVDADIGLNGLVTYSIDPGAQQQSKASSIRTEGNFCDIEFCISFTNLSITILFDTWKLLFDYHYISTSVSQLVAVIAQC